eukprot:TRINITY_DN1452_c0_g2_i2.p3 TRINITY_DN1452_c0_g2~~TRINITY_DN1452_c0_g2_i2.p3  ORF type:complete len:510 (+),score=123.96 TRINITY_DN1452_c0_g2_i2:11012-12541(+)
MGDDFTSQLLKGFERRADAAKKQVEERARRAAEQRQRLKEEQEQAEKERLAAEVDQMMARANQRVSSKRKKRKKKPVASKAAASSSSNSEPKPPQPKKPIPKHHVSEMRTNYRAPPKRTGPGRVPKLGPNMEFVVRREKKKKQIRVPHTYDYSDMFGDDYWRGIDIDGAKKISKETAEATKEAQQIIAERKAQREENKRQMEQTIREVRELEKKGLWDEKTQNKRRLEHSEKEWVAVDTPVPIFRQKNSAIARAAQSSSSASKPLASLWAKPASVASKPLAKKESVAQVKERARLFKERLMGLNTSSAKKTVPSKGAKSKNSSGSDSDVDRRPSSDKKRTPLKRRVYDSEGSEDDGDRRGKKRKRRPSQYSGSDSEYDRKSPSAKKRRRARDFSDDSDSGYGRGSLQKSRQAREDGGDSDLDRRSSRKSYGNEKKRHSSRKSYNSDEWSDSNNDDDSDEEDFFDISALDREEARSERIAKLEDKRELAKLRRDKKEKERRRREFEAQHG